jgi:Flp pilus assembly pilin Flp
MQSGFRELCLRLQSFLARDEGQDLVEYVLVTMLVAVGAVVSMRTVAAPLNALLGNAVTALGNTF